MKLLFATALLSVIEAAQIERGYDRHSRLAGFGIHGYRTRISKPLPHEGLYNTSYKGYYLDHSDTSGQDSTHSESGDGSQDSSDSVFYSRESSAEEISDDSSDSRYSHRSFSSHGGSGYTHSHDSTSDYLKGSDDSHGSSASDAYHHDSDITSHPSGLSGSDDSYFSKDSIVYDHRNGRQPYSEGSDETDGSSYDFAHSLSLDSSDDAYGSSEYSGESGYSWDSNGSGISSKNGHQTPGDIDLGYYFSPHGRNYYYSNYEGRK